MHGMGGHGALSASSQGGVLKSYSLSDPSHLDHVAKGELSFVQISDSHMGFNKAANPDVVGDIESCRRQNQCSARHLLNSFCTLAISAHLSKPEEFDTVDQILQSAPTKESVLRSR